MFDHTCTAVSNVAAVYTSVAVSTAAAVNTCAAVCSAVAVYTCAAIYTAAADDDEHPQVRSYVIHLKSCFFCACIYMHRLLNVLLYTFDKHVNYTIVKKYVYMGGNIYIYTCIIPLSPLGSLGRSIGYPRPPWATSILFGGYGLPCAPLR